MTSARHRTAAQAVADPRFTAAAPRFPSGRPGCGLTRCYAAVVAFPSRVRPANGAWLVSGPAEPPICWISSRTPAGESRRCVTAHCTGRVGAPYAVATLSVLIGLACGSVGDEEAAKL
jgi:hypothetical protein